jgi:hypothetical protein
VSLIDARRLPGEDERLLGRGRSSSRWDCEGSKKPRPGSPERGFPRSR